MIYTDGTHLITDDPIDELHIFAEKIGLKRTWFQNHPRHPHYDIWGSKVRKAINNGAMFISSKELVRKLRKRKNLRKQQKQKWLKGVDKMKYRKKPVIIEAMEFNEKDKDRVFKWITCTTTDPIFVEGKPALKIQTLEGVMTAQLGDYIIKGVNGEFYPCKPDIFVKTYEPLEDKCNENSI